MCESRVSPVSRPDGKFKIQVWISSGKSGRVMGKMSGMFRSCSDQNKTRLARGYKGALLFLLCSQAPLHAPPGPESYSRVKHAVAGHAGLPGTDDFCNNDCIADRRLCVRGRV